MEVILFKELLDRTVREVSFIRFFKAFFSGRSWNEESERELGLGYKQILMEEEQILVHVSTQRCGFVQASFSSTPPWAALVCCSGTDVCC